MMTGALEVLNESNCALVSGHTGEGKELAVGFAVNGLIDDAPAQILRKNGTLPSDVLILTKPIGMETLFATYARLAAKGLWIDVVLQTMIVSNQKGVQCLSTFGATACTNLTGFGLLGHLVEITRPSGVDAVLYLCSRPLLEGGTRLRYGWHCQFFA
jgi:selenide,water dikinase